MPPARDLPIPPRMAEAGHADQRLSGRNHLDDLLKSPIAAESGPRFTPGGLTDMDGTAAGNHSIPAKQYPDSGENAKSISERTNALCIAQEKTHDSITPGWAATTAAWLLFENLFPHSPGRLLQPYLIVDLKAALIDTAGRVHYQTISGKYAHTLDGARPGHLIVNHMEPDHCANIEELLCATRT